MRTYEKLQALPPPPNLMAAELSLEANGVSEKFPYCTSLALIETDWLVASTISCSLTSAAASPGTLKIGTAVASLDFVAMDKVCVPSACFMRFTLTGAQFDPERRKFPENVAPVPPTAVFCIRRSMIVECEKLLLGPVTSCVVVGCQ